MKLVKIFGLIAVFSATSSFAQDVVGPTTTPGGSITTASVSVSGTINTQSVVFVTGSSAASAPTSASSSSTDTGTDLSSEQLGGIIGGCAGAFILIVFSVILIVFGRRRRSDDFDIAPGVSTTTLTEMKGSPNRKNSKGGKNKQYATDSNGKNVKRYNFNGKSDIENGPVIAPVIIYSDSMNQEQQQAMGIEKHLLDEEAMPLRELSDQPAGKRLSKYNFLSQAFSQMRTSYAPDNGNNNDNHHSIEDQPRSPSSASAASQKELIVKKPKKYQMYSMYQDSNGEIQTPTSPPPAHSINSYNPGDPTRESTVTVGTLHAPLFLQNRGTPSPSLPKQSKSPLKMPNRDSLVSEVSEYSTYPTSPHPPRSPSTPTGGQKRYPFV